MVVAFATLRGGLTAAVTTVGLGIAGVSLVIGLSGLPVVLSVGVLALLCWAPTSAGAEVLRRTSSLEASICFISILGLLTVVLLMALQAPMSGFWAGATEQLKLATEADSPLSPMGAFSDEQLVSLLHAGAGVTVIVFAASGLFLGRSGQAKLLNPGGFQREFHALYFGKYIAIGCLVLMFAGFFTGGALGITLATIASFPLLLQGLAVVHALVKERSLGVGWLVVLYSLLIVLQPATLLVGGVGFIDNVRRLPRR